MPLHSQKWLKGQTIGSDNHSADNLVRYASIVWYYGTIFSMGWMGPKMQIEELEIANGDTFKVCLIVWAGSARTMIGGHTCGTVFWLKSESIYL